LVPPVDALLGILPDAPEMRGWSPGHADGFIADADAVLSQGGGFLLEAYQPWTRLRAYELIIHRGLPLALANLSIGQFHQARERRLLRHALMKAAAIGLRDADCAGTLIELCGRTEGVVHGADAVFGLFSEPPPAVPQHGVALVISAGRNVGRNGVTVDPREHMETLEGLLRLTIELGGGEPVTVLSTAPGLSGPSRGEEDDVSLAAEVIDAVGDDRVVQHRDYLAPMACASLIARHRALISMRLHPVIFGPAAGVPSPLCNGSAKATSMLPRLGLADVLAPGLEDPSGLSVALDRLRPPGPVRGLALWRRLEPAKSAAARGLDVVHGLLERLDGHRHP
jgi:polysaccharide pyruvyl transferase WcaK-like protein